MSILNGTVSASVVRPEQPPFGRRLRLRSSIPLPGCADVAVSPDGALAYAVYRGGLVVYALEKDAPPAELGRVEGLCGCRQIAVSEGIAYVTARQDGLFIADVRDPQKPALLCHRDTLELATGVCAAQKLCLVTNRHMGVEIWDVSDPAAPVYCAAFLAGEAQSVCMDGGYAYVGDWVNRRVWIAEITDPHNPRIVSSFQIDGYADGIFVRGGLCFAAGGHHSAALKNRRKYKDYPYMTPQMLQDGYGCGHGLTLFDVSVPDAPEFLSEVKFPPLFGKVDTWRVTASGGFAYAADSHNGVFAVDISDPLHPFIAAHYPLPFTDPQAGQPALQTARAAATGIACADGTILAAGGDSGLHVLDFGPARPAGVCASPKGPVPQAAFERVFACGGQFHSFVHEAGHLVLACGDDGLYALPDSGGETVFHAPVCGIAHDVARMDGYLYTAEGNRGVSVWRFSPTEGFSPVDRWECPDGCVRQVVPLPGRGMLAVQLDVWRIGFLQAAADGSLRPVRELPAGGMLYHRHLCRMPHPSGFLAAMPLNGGLLWIDLDRMEPACPDWHIPEPACPLEDGAAMDGDRIWIVRARRCGMFRDPGSAAEALRAGALRPVEGAQLRGMPFPADGTLVILNRVTGTVERLDIRQPDAPRLLDRTVLPARPEFAAPAAGCTWIACGHEGLYRIRNA